MKLSELKTGEKGVIVKVLGHGGFRKRIIEMGFIKGKEVEVLLNAPLQDPVKYKLMGYEVSLRHQEAESIEVVTSEELRVKSEEYAATSTSSDTKVGDSSFFALDSALHKDDYLQHAASP
jgi:ferrous iron transport protein B